MRGEPRLLSGRETWVHDDEGEGPPVFLLHGGLGSSDDLAGQATALAATHRVVAVDRRGHGRTADTDQPFSYAAMAEEAVAALEAIVGGPAHLVGWSDGGIVALFVALTRPDLVSSLVLIGTNFHRHGLVPGFLDIGPDDPVVAQLGEAYAERSPDGADHWPVVVAKTLALWQAEPNLTVDDIATVVVPTLVLVGDDEPISLEHTVALYEALPRGQMAMVPGASHLVVIEKPALVNTLIADFLDADGPPATLMPMRRRRPDQG